MPDIIQPFKAVGVQDRKDEIYWDGLAECYQRGCKHHMLTQMTSKPAAK